MSPEDKKLLELQLKLDKIFEKNKKDPQYRKSHMMELSKND